jgi:aminomethyltransferase
MTVEILRTPLFELAKTQHARFTAFSGWEMPVQFSGLKLEHHAVRSSAGMFDISHMGKFMLTGGDLITQLQTLVPSDLARLKPGLAQYTVLLNPQGGIVDDIIIYDRGRTLTGEEQALIIVNAGTTDKDKAWLLEHLNDSISLEDLTSDYALIALQGPQAAKILQPLQDSNLAEISAFSHRQINIQGESAFLARTGYTGEDGFEIMLPAETACQLWNTFVEAGVTPCGLGARDTLRLEAAMSLYGHEIDDTTTPLEAGLGWLVHLNKKGDFIGREVLETQKAQGLPKRLVGLEMTGRYIAREGYSIVTDSRVVGKVTSGTLSPTLEKAIALGYVPQALSKIGQQLEIDIRGKTHPAKVVKKPFYRSPNKI